MRTTYLKKTLRIFEDYGYRMTYFEDFDYTLLKNVIVRVKPGKHKGQTGTRWADVIIMGDTETSRKTLNPKTELEHHNHVCAWSIALRTGGLNVVTLWGRKPSDMMDCIGRIREQIDCDELYLYFHNLPYDWVFLRQFFFRKFGEPTSQLNVKPLYPLYVRFKNGLVLRDSLMLAQRSLEKWGMDLAVQDAKAVGKWDYDKLRSQHESFTLSELTYIEHDVLCGVECIDATMKSLKKNLSSIPMTATGIPRQESRAIGSENRAHEWAVGLMPDTYAEQMIFEAVFHGGYTHVNRFIKGIVFCNGGIFADCCSEFVKCVDFSSSYPFCLLAYKYPAEKFWPIKKKVDADYVLRNADTYAFVFKVTATQVRLRDPRCPMPCLALAKCILSVNVINDNGRIEKCDNVEFWTNEIDFQTQYAQYDFKDMKISDVQCAVKDYLPRWFTDYVYERYELKTNLKGGDPVNYAIEKAKLNSLYGMCAQRPVKPDITENYETGEYSENEDFDWEAAYDKYLNNYNTYLPYNIGIYCTSYAQRNLFTLGSFVPASEYWIYSDTDSVYATGFDQEKLDAYNNQCRQMLLDRGYAPVLFKGKNYTPGVSEDDGTYTEFCALHSKCYVKRPLVATMDGENGFIMSDHLKITVAGVPKKGAKSLGDDIENFHHGTLFDGKTSGKLQHTHFFVPAIYEDDDGNETGDSIELSPCDYIVSDPDMISWNKLMEEEIMMIDYEKEWTVSGDD